MSIADENLLQIVAGNTAAILVTRIRAVLEQITLDEETEGGVVEVEVLREVTREKWHGPSNKVPLGFSRSTSRAVRIRSGMQGFNGVELTPGNLVLVALLDIPESERGQPLTSPLSPLSVAPLGAPDDPLVRGVEKALAIQPDKPEPVRLRLVREALDGTLPFLVEYGHYAAGRLGRIPRRAAVAMELELFEDESRSPRDRAMAEATLELELWREDEPEDPENRKIVEAFFRQLGTADKELRLHVVEALHAMLDPDAAPGSEEAQRSEALMKGVKIPKGPKLRAAMGAIAGDPSTSAHAPWLYRVIAKNP